MPLSLAEPSAIADITVNSLVQAVYRHLEATSYGILNRLTETVGSSDTNIPFEFDVLEAIRPGAFICIDTEVMYVWTYDKTTKIANVQRGMLGSLQHTHIEGALVQIQPRVSTFDVLTKLAEEIRSWPPALYQIATTTIAAGTTTRGYDLAAEGITRVLEVRGTITAGNSVAVNIPGYHIDFNADVSIYPSGTAIIFNDSCRAQSVEVIYAKPFTTSLFELDTPLTVVGLTDTQRDIPELGAASRLLREAPRTDTRNQGQSGVDAKVPPGYTGSTRTSLRREADARIHQEIARLREKYPQRKA